VPVAMTSEDIAALKDAYVAAARRAHDLGPDFLEIHAAHGYLLHNFLSPLANQRTDRYGGSLHNRMRLPLEVFECVRTAWPEAKPVGVRVSATDWCEGGWTLDDSVELARELRLRGCDYITASSGGMHPDQRIEVGPGYQVRFAKRIRDEAGIATVAIGLITEPAQAERILQSESADVVALGRGMLFNPRWPWHAALELGEEAAFPPQYERAHPKMRMTDFLKPRHDG
jgi:2,4-dienoyl-CoA reductase-like NADH-dependent reductase (Old Yellow Enzyme family)